MKKIRVIELFAGYGSQHLALKRLKRDYPEFEYEVVAFCEIDDNAIKAYHALHGDHIPNLGDITQVNPSDVPDCDLMTWSFPCQSISSAGLQHGLAEGSGTRSSLCWNAMRIFEVKRPKYLLMENVSALVSDKFIGDFNLLQSSLQKIGYTNFTQLMNAKDYGVPQNRLRVFMVSVLDCSQAYYFPKPFPLEKRLKDVLESNVPDRYYLSQERLAGLKLSNEKEKEAGRGFEFAPKSADSVGDNAVSTNAGGRKTDNFLQEPCVETVGQYDSSQNSRIIDPNGISQTVINGHKDGTPKIADPLPAAARGRAAGDWHTSEHRQTLELGDPAAANSVTSVAKDSMIVEPAILQQQRTEEGKEIRRQHKGDKGIPYAHKELSQRGDGTSNTLTSVAKDNMVVEQALCIGSMQKNAYIGTTEQPSPCINAACGMGGGQTPMVTEPVILTQQRTEEGKALRREHPGDVGIPYAHKELTPRQDGISNTLSTVEKDNLLAEPTIIDTTNSCFEHGGITQHENISPTLRSQRTGLLATEPAIIEDFYPDRPARVYEEQAPTIRSDRTGLKVTEPAVLGWTRSGDSKGEPTYHPVDVANCVTASKRDNTQNYVVEPQVQQVGQLVPDSKFANPQRGRIYSPAGLAPAVDTAQGGNLVAKIKVPIEPTRQNLIQYHLTDDGNLRAYIDDEKKTGVSELQITNPNNPAPTLTGANHAKVWQSIEELIEQAKTAHPSRGIIMIKDTPCWVRRLTERELFRLMDVEENDIDTLLNAGISNTQLAKLAGNSVVCACYYHIFRKLFIDTNANVNEQLQLF